VMLVFCQSVPGLHVSWSTSPFPSPCRRSGRHFTGFDSRSIWLLTGVCFWGVLSLAVYGPPRIPLAAE
jgi:hypothetical protein